MQATKAPFVLLEESRYFLEVHYANTAQALLMNYDSTAMQGSRMQQMLGSVIAEICQKKDYLPKTFITFPGSLTIHIYLFIHYSVVIRNV